MRTVKSARVQLLLHPWIQLTLRSLTIVQRHCPLQLAVITLLIQIARASASLGRWHPALHPAEHLAGFNLFLFPASGDYCVHKILHATGCLGAHKQLK